MENKSKLLIQRISEGNPLQAQYIDRVNKKGTVKTDESMLSYLVEFWESLGMDLQTMADAYLEFIFQAMVEQVYFKKHHQYKNREYSDICQDNYGNSDYMENYLVALEISDCLWENHLLVRNWYIQRLEEIGNCKKFVEIGCGGGLNLIPIFKQFRETHCVAVDLSEKSTEVCRKFLNWAYEKGLIFSTDFEVICQNVFEWNCEDAPDVLIMFEVLEHVPNPRELLHRIFEIMDEHTVFFLSTVINSPMPDHVYLFRNQGEVKDMVETTGFDIVDCYCAPANSMTMEEAERTESPITIALELKKGDRNDI